MAGGLRQGDFSPNKRVSPATSADSSALLAVSAVGPVRIGFFSIGDQADEESALRAAVESHAEFLWHRFKGDDSAKTAMPPERELDALCPGAVIVVLRT